MKLLTPRQVAEITQLAEQTLAHHRCSGTGPPFVKIGGAVRYIEDDLHKWIEDQAHANQRESRAVSTPSSRRTPRAKSARRLGGRPKKRRDVIPNEGPQ